MEGNIHRRDRTIYVNCILPCSTEDDLFTLFSRAGPIEKVIFKNCEGTPQHALIVFRRLESVMFCLDNKDFFKLKGENLGIRALKESRHIQKNHHHHHHQDRVPRSAGYEHHRKEQNFFNFDTANVESFRQRSSESESLCTPSPADSWKSPSPTENDFHLMGPPPPRRFRPPPPLQLSHPQPTRDHWMPNNRDFAHPPFSAGMINNGQSVFNYNRPTEIPTWEQFRDMQSPFSPLRSSDNLFAGLSPIGSGPDMYNGFTDGPPPLSPRDFGSSFSIDRFGGDNQML